jgi:hypothetical protein
VICFVVSLHQGCATQQEKMVLSGLRAHFPKLYFVYGAALDGYENSIGRLQWGGIRPCLVV